MPTWRNLAAASSGPGSRRAAATCSGVMPTPSSVRRISTAPSARTTVRLMLPAQPLGSMPWKMAFSTSGCNVKRGILHCRASFSSSM